MDSSAAHRKDPKSYSRRRTTTTPSSASWCCSFKSPPKSPETKTLNSIKKNHHPPSESGLTVVGRIDRRRILSPGRVSPIDSDPTPKPQSQPHPDPDPPKLSNVVQEPDSGVREESGNEEEEEEEGVFDVRLSLIGRNGGGCVVLELNSRVLRENSSVFATMIANSRKNSSRFCRIEVPEVENVAVFRETIELMFEDDITKWLIKVGAYRAIDILEISASIKFNRGVLSCLKYIEAVSWTEEEEEKLRRLFTKFKFDEATSYEILSRLNLNDTPQHNIATQLVRSITTCGNAKARNELKPMVKGLLSKSSVYEKDLVDITKEDLYSVSQSCISSLVTLFQEEKKTDKPLIELVSWQVDNLNWLLEILLDRHMAEDFVDMWAGQEELIEMHKKASPMVRYELSRVSAALFVAMGTRKLQCQSGSRFGLLNSWFGPMMMDFGWLQRCRKGLDVREVEEAMGQALLTLPLKHQYALFMEWFRCFSKNGTECPNLSKAFQIWWRRSFLRGSETHAIETR